MFSNRPSPSGGVTPQPPSLEKRLPIALGLMMLVLLASQYFFKPAPGPKPVKSETAKSAVQSSARPTPAPVVIEPASSQKSAGQVRAAAEITSEIDTTVFRVAFTNRGG